MIYGNLRNWDREKRFFPAAFSDAFSYLDSMNLASLPAGKHILDGERMFAMVNEVSTEPEETKRFELHERYLDIQLLLSGTEKQLFAPAVPSPGPEFLENALATDDIAFCAFPKEYGAIILAPDDYTIYLPGELHCPCCAVERPAPVRKIVFKVHRELI